MKPNVYNLTEKLSHRSPDYILRRVRKLLEVGDDPNVRGFNNAVPLHAAARYGNTRLVALLLQYGADPNACDDDGFTPLMGTNVAAVVRLLLEAGADPNAVSKSGCTALRSAYWVHMKISLPFPDVIAVLKEYGAREIAYEGEAAHPTAGKGAANALSDVQHREPIAPSGFWVRWFRHDKSGG